MAHNLPAGISSHQTNSGGDCYFCSGAAESEGKMGPSGHERRGKCYIPSPLHRYAVCVLTSPLPLRLPPLRLRRPGLFSYRLRLGAPAADYMNYLQCVNPPQLLFVLASLPHHRPTPPLSQSGESGRIFFLPHPPALSLSHNFVTSPSCRSLPVSAPGVRLCLALCLLSPSL